MIGPLKTLFRIKRLREQQALRAMQRKLQEVRAAEVKLAERQWAVEESRRSLPAREDALYAEILGRSVALGDIEEIKGMALRLGGDHERLMDDVERARHVHLRLLGELDHATEVYRQSLKESERYLLLGDQAAAIIAAEERRAEESELEDLFSRVRNRAA